MKGKVYWFVGLSGSGKTTITKELLKVVEKEHLVGTWRLLDGDVIRSFLADEIGYSAEERRKSVKIMGLLAKTLAENGIHVIVANISPFQDIRDFMREHIESYHEIYCKCPIEACMGRDPKGNYKKQLEEGLKDYVGLDIPFDLPENPNITIDTEKLTLGESVKMAMDYILKTI